MSTSSSDSTRHYSNTASCAGSVFDSQSFLQEHGILQAMEELLVSLLHEEPKDPWAYSAQFLGRWEKNKTTERTGQL